MTYTDYCQNIVYGYKIRYKEFIAAVENKWGKDITKKIVEKYDGYDIGDAMEQLKASLNISFQLHLICDPKEPENTRYVILSAERCIKRVATSYYTVKLDIEELESLCQLRPLQGCRKAVEYLKLYDTDYYNGKFFYKNLGLYLVTTPFYRQPQKKEISTQIDEIIMKEDIENL